MNEKSKIKLQLSVQKQKSDSYVVGSSINSVFIEVPEEAVAIIKCCDGSKSVEEIQDFLAKDKNMDIDVLDFLQTLEEMNLIYSIDGEVCISGEKKTYSTWLKRLSNILFNKCSAVIYMLLFLVNFIVIVSNKTLFPKIQDIFFIENRTGINMLIFFIINWIIILLHEFGHFLSVVRLDVNAKFNLSLRLIWLVVEADINGLWSVEKKKRYFSYFAGICFETVIMTIAILIKLSNINMIANSIAGVVILIVSLDFLSQFMIFLRTDLYLVLLTYFNMSSLYEYSKSYIKSKLIHKEDKSLNELSSKEMRYIKLFSLSYIFGIVFGAVWLFYEASIILNTLYNAVIQISIGDLMLKFDAILVIVVIVVDLFLWAKGAINKRRSESAN